LKGNVLLHWYVCEIVDRRKDSSTMSTTFFCYFMYHTVKDDIFQP
jgi:hypothetical protein